jgi:hypothetical protein
MSTAHAATASRPQFAFRLVIGHAAADALIQQPVTLDWGCA